MILKFILVCAALFALLTFLKFVEDSPVRSWKSVFLIGIPLCVIAFFYIQWAFPPPPPPQPRSERVAINLAELERTVRRVEGVDRAAINGRTIEMNFVERKPIAELKKIARHVGGAGAYFLQDGKTNKVTVRITVRGADRYRADFEYGKGLVYEHEFSVGF